MNSDKTKPSKVNGCFRRLFLKDPDSQKLLQSLLSPQMFILGHLLCYTLYFSDLPYWWFLTLLFQSSLSLLGLFIPSWRLPALTIITILLIYNLTWIISPLRLNEACKDKIVTIDGIIKNDSHQHNVHYDLSKCSVKCLNKSFQVPMARLVNISQKSNPWMQFKAGDKVEFKSVRILDSGRYFIKISPDSGFRTYNVSRQTRILNRKSLLVFFQNKARYYLNGFPLGVYKSLITADRSDLNQHWKKIFSDLGIIHIFAISGMHIGILFIWFSLVLRKLLSYPLGTVLKGSGILISDFFSVLMILLFISTIGMPISAIRAVIMLGWWLIIKYIFRWQPLWFILTGTATLILLEEPTTLGQISFQLSFVSVAGILFILPLLPIASRSDTIFQKISKNVLSTFIISCWLLIFTAPITQTLTNQQTLLLPLNNLIHIAFVSLIFLPIALIVLLQNLISYYIGFGFGEFYLYSAIHFISRIWEIMLTFNSYINTPFLIKLPDFWTYPLRIIYWTLILLILSKIKRNIKNVRLATRQI